MSNGTGSALELTQWLLVGFSTSWAVGLKVSVARGCPWFLARCPSPPEQTCMKSQRENANKLEVRVFHNLIMQVMLYDSSIHFKQVHSQDAAHSKEMRITQGIIITSVFLNSTGWDVSSFHTKGTT